MKQHPRLGAWLSQARRLDERWLSIAQVPFGPKRAVVNDVLMAGDSAGLIVPLAGDGIAMALRGGQLAASHGLAYLAGAASAARCAAAMRAPGSANLAPGCGWAGAAAPRASPAAAGARAAAAQRRPALGRYLVLHTRAAGYGPAKENV